MDTEMRTQGIRFIRQTLEKTLQNGMHGRCGEDNIIKNEAIFDKLVLLIRIKDR